MMDQEEHPTVQDELSYSSFVDLTNIFENQTPEDIFITLNKDSEEITEDWKKQFQFFTDLRIVNKFFPQNLKLFLSSFCKQISVGLLHLRSQIQKNAVLFVQEVFDLKLTGEKQIPDDFINVVIPNLFDNSISSKQFVKKEALQVIKNIEKNKIQLEIVQDIVQQCFHKNFTISELASNTIIKYFLNNKGQIKEIFDEKYINMMIDLSVKLYQGKRTVLNQNASKIAKILREEIGEVQLQQIAKKNFQTKESNIFIKLIEQKKTLQKQPQQSLKDLIKIKQQQQKEIETQENNNGVN